MVVQFILKGLFFYFLFLFVRSFFKSANRPQHSGRSHSQSGQTNYQTGHKKKGNSEDIVEAEFRRL